MKKEHETLSEKRKDFEKDDEIRYSRFIGRVDEDGKEKEIIFVYPEKDVKEFIKQGDKIFYSKDYGNDNVSNEEYDYAVKKWEEFKKLAGEKLLK